MSNPSFFFIANLISFLLMNTNYAAGDTDQYSTCDSNFTTCGNGILIRYPFWVANETTATNNKYCGYPEFKLTCSQNGQPILTLPTNSYYVTEINYESDTLTLVDIDVVNQSCPRARNNVSLASYPLSYNELDLNLTFYFNCSTNVSYYLPDSIGCFVKSISRKESYVFVKGNETKGYDWSTECEEMVEVVVKEIEISDENSGGLVSEFGKAMGKGFVLDWEKARDCVHCEDSGGYCGGGYVDDRSTDEILCFCKDGSVTTSRCKKKDKFSLRNKAIVASVACLLTAIFILGGYYLYRRRKRSSYAKSIIQSSQATSSVFSSKMQDAELGSKSYVVGVHVFTYTELEEATDHFNAAKELGDGGFGTVYFGKLQDGRCVAVKRLYENNYKRVEQFMNEVEILSTLRHQNLVSLYGCTSRHSRELLLVYEYIPNGTVADHLHGERAKPGSLPWSTRMNIAIETASALVYLHAKDIIHRDVKTNNILLDNHFCVKVADFGLSRLFPEHVTHISTAPQGTPGYVDPEYHECYQLTHKSDVYSFGVVLIELISSMPAVDITRHRHEINLSTMAINKIQNRALHELVDPTLGFERDYKVRKMINGVAELAFQCLQSMKDMRPSMEEVLDVLRDIESDGKLKEGKAEVMDISADDVGLLKNDMAPPLPSPDSKMGSKSTTPNTSN